MNTFFVLLTTYLLETECARKNMEGFIIGGYKTNIAANPHSLFLSATCETTWICGASILNQQVILTAAHCLFSCNITHSHRIEVSAGSGNLKSIKIKRSVTKLVVHQFYQEVTVWNDIGVALLDKKIPLGLYTKRVIIHKFFPFDTPYGTVAGWGIVDEETQKTSVSLKQVSQRLRSRFTCAKIGYLIPGMFCAGSENYYDDHPAAGDSGGALITDKYIAIGIVSFHVPPYPALSVYTNVTFYFDWLTKTTKDMFCNG